MSKMGQLVMEIEELLYQGMPAEDVAKKLLVPLSFVLPIEDNMMAMNDPRNYGPDYDETY